MVRSVSDGIYSPRKKLSSTPVLAFSRPKDTFISDTDASNRGIGAVVLSQVQDRHKWVITYGSRKLTKLEWNYCTARKEMLEMVNFMKHFCSYLLGQIFIVRIGHTALEWLHKFREPEGQIARWLELLQEYKFTTQHHPSKSMVMQMLCQGIQ